MSVSATIALEANFSGAVWTDIIADSRAAQGISMSRGIRGSGPTYRVASPGSMSFHLNNSALNSGSKLGYYSPDHANARSGFENGLKTRLKITYDGTTYYKFRGKVINIEPSAGQYGPRDTYVEAADYIEEMGRHKVDKVAVQLSKRDDQALTTLIANMPIAPVATSYATGPDTYTYVLHDIKDESTTVLNACQRLMQSGAGYLFVKGDQTGGETLTYQSRTNRISGATSQATLDDTMVSLQVTRPVDAVFNRIVAVTYPAEVDSAATTVLFTLQKEVSIGAGDTLVLTCRYRDPSGARTRVSGDAMTDPLVGDTNFKVSSVSGDNGNDLNGSVTIVEEYGGNTGEISITNNHTGTAYLNKLELTGKGIYLYDPIQSIAEDTDSQDTHGERTLVFDMKYQDNTNVGMDVSNAFLGQYKDPYTSITGCTFIANTNDTLMTAALNVEIGDLVTIAETVTGINADFFVNGIDFDITDDGLITCSWVLEPSVAAAYLILDDANFAQLDSTAVLGW